MNNLIQLACKWAPCISLALLDARVGNRKDAGLGSRATKLTKWSTVAAHAEEIAQDAADHVGKSVAVLADRERWVVPKPVELPAELAEYSAVQVLRATESYQWSPLAANWGRTYNNRWFATAKARDDRLGRNRILYIVCPRARYRLVVHLSITHM